MTSTTLSKNVGLSVIILVLSCSIQTAMMAQTSVLFIGNSYTTENDLPNTFRLLSQSLGEDVTIAVSAPGGFTFQDHYSYAPTQQLIESQDWNYVVLQEQSQLPAFPDDLETTTLYGGALTAQIETNFECTWPVFYMTWGRENGDQQNCASNPPVCTYEGMQQLIRSRYIQLGEQNDGYVAPVGMAWREVLNTRPSIDLFQPDGSHPTPAGTYLAACVMYSTIFQGSSIGSSYHANLSASVAAILQEIATSTVLDSTDTWNLDAPNGTDATLMGYSSDGPDDITVYHFGEGTHLWTCSNGQSATGTSATFTFAAPGIYTITHIYDDPCGNTDTWTWDVEVYEVGLEELDPSSLRVRASNGIIEVSGGRQGDRLVLFDPIGRTILERTLSGTEEKMLAPVGALIWSIVRNGHRIVTGKIMTGIE